MLIWSFTRKNWNLMAGVLKVDTSKNSVLGNFRNDFLNIRKMVSVQKNTIIDSQGIIYYKTIFVVYILG